MLQRVFSGREQNQFGDLPSHTDWVEHNIDMGDAQPSTSFSWETKISRRWG